MTKEEAIKIIKRTKDVMVYTEKEEKALEILIPELSESEDEKIANAIKLILSEVPMERFDDEGVDYAKCLEYIEKQKEQEHNEDDFTIYHPLKNEKGKYECIPYSFYGSLTSFSEDKDLIDFLRTCFYTEEECNEWIEQQKEQKQQPPFMGGDTDAYFDDLRMTTKPLTSREWFNEGIKYAQRLQKEQKPAEWSDTDNIGWDEAFACVTRAEKSAKNEEELQNAVTAEKWLKEIKFKYYVHPDKQEWSEEDEYMYKMVSSIVHGTFIVETQETEDKLLSWLKSLRPQPKSNVSDMITPNKEFFKWIYDRLVNVHKENPNVDYMISFKKRIEELLFDKPHWKPSGEQMEAFSQIVQQFKPDKELESLYNDLQKLK